MQLNETYLQGEGNGRAFINVVDIDGSSLLEDIVASVPEKPHQQRAAPDREDMRGSPTRQRFKSSLKKETGMDILDIITRTLEVPLCTLITCTQYTVHEDEVLNLVLGHHSYVSSACLSIKY